MATLEISTQRQFGHTEDLLGYQVANNDPRRANFDWESVRIDLRRCEFVRPAGVLWCTIYALLVTERGIPCELVVPDQPLTATYLNDLGLFSTLKDAGVHVGYDASPNLDRWQLVLPITQLGSISDVEELENTVVENLESRNLSSVNVHTDVSVAFAELANNAVEHAESSVSAYGLVQFYEWDPPRFVCAVADGGIGIRASLQKNPEYARLALTDWNAIDYATLENVSGTQDSLRGMGLHHIVNDILPPDRELNINSGLGFLHADGGAGPTRIRRSYLFPGTSTFINVPIGDRSL